MIAPGSTGYPEMLLLLGAGAKIIGGQCVEATARKSELLGRFSCCQRVLPKNFEHVTDERRSVTVE